MKFEALHDNMPPEAEDLERSLRDQLTRLQQAYHAAAEPIIKRLSRLYDIYPPRYVLIPEAGDEVKLGGLGWLSRDRVQRTAPGVLRHAED